jgi:hypothetical protein
MASDKLDDLVLLERLAAGGMAEVYRALQQGYGGFEKVVAVKRILPHFASDEEFKNMFVMEAQLSGLLQHPNVVHVYSNGESEGYLYLVMEFVDGKNLRQLLARADKQKVRIPIESACYIIAEAAKGLEYAHSFVDERTGQAMEIVHRDMSPQNIMLSYDGGVKIVDFGIAKAAARSEHTRAGVLKGKFGYMSPEQAQGMPIDRRSDIFALGIIFFELLTQRRLFSHDDDMRTLQLIRECNVPRPSKYNPVISPALDRIVLKALAKNRSDRYATAGEFYADVQRFVNQKYPQFLPMEFAKFLKTKIFADDIVAERKKRETLAAEAPARLGGAPASRRKVAMPGGAEADKDATKVDFSDEISEITRASEVRELASPQKIDISEVHENMETELAAAPLASESTRLTDSGSAEEDLPLPAGSEGKKLEVSSAAFKMNSGPSHLSLSVAMNNESLPVRKNVPTPRPASELRPRPSEIMAAKAQAEGQAASAYREITFAKEEGATKRLLGSRAYLAIMALAATGAYFHFSATSQTKTAVVAQEKTSAPKAATPGEASSGAEPQVAATTGEGDRKPASHAQVHEGPTYSPQGATGYLNFKTFPAATEIWVDGQILADAAGTPVRAPANLQKVEVGTRKLRLINKALGLSWEGEVDVEFDSVKTLEVRLK